MYIKLISKSVYLVFAFHLNTNAEYPQTYYYLPLDVP